MESRVKTRRLLPELDLARIAPMPSDQKRRELERMKFGRPPYTYNPMRKGILDILNVEAGPLVDLPRTPWEAVAADIRRRGRTEDEINANLRAAEGLYVFASTYGLVGQRQDFFPLNMGISEKVTYWSPVVVEIDGRPAVPFFDPRRTKKLTARARQFVFSVMHERIRVLDPDFFDVRLAIIQFANSAEGMRAVVPHFDDDVDLLSFEVLDEMVRETYQIWHEVLEQRESEARRDGTGKRGALI